MKSSRALAAQLVLGILLAFGSGCAVQPETTQPEEEVGQASGAVADCKTAFQICWNACEDGTMSAGDMWTFCHQMDFSGMCKDEPTPAEKTECEAIMQEACMSGGEQSSTLMNAAYQNCLDGCASKQVACLESQPVCTYDAQCGSGQMCIQNKCYKKCTSNLNCYRGDFCAYWQRGKVCIPESWR